MNNTKISILCFDLSNKESWIWKSKRTSWIFNLQSNRKIAIERAKNYRWSLYITSYYDCIKYRYWETGQILRYEGTTPIFHDIVHLTGNNKMLSSRFLWDVQWGNTNRRARRFVVIMWLKTNKNINMMSNKIKLHRYINNSFHW